GLPFDQGAPLSSRRQITVVPPPIKTDFLCLVEGTDEQSDPDGQQLNFGERHLDISRNHKSLVEHTVQNVHQAGRTMMGWRKVERHVAANYIARISAAATGITRRSIHR